MGRETMGKLERRVEGLEAAVRPKSISLAAVAGLILAVATPLLTMAYAAGKYPDRGEFDDAKNRGEQRLEDVRTDLANTQKELVKLRIELENVSAGQGRVELQLGRMEQAMTKRPR
jgi:hypothetical protein